MDNWSLLIHPDYNFDPENILCFTHCQHVMSQILWVREAIEYSSSASKPIRRYTDRILLGFTAKFGSVPKDGPKGYMRRVFYLYNDEFANLENQAIAGAPAGAVLVAGIRLGQPSMVCAGRALVEMDPVGGVQ